MRFIMFELQRQWAIGVSAALLGGALLCICASSVASEPDLKFATNQAQQRVTILAGEQAVATYYSADEKIARPFYAHVGTSDGIPVTRTFPPKDGEPTDHAEMHPGIWLAFGDLSGNDFWRNKGRVKQVKFLTQPEARKNRVSFLVQNEYVMGDAEKKLVAKEICRHTWSSESGGILLTLDSELESGSPTEPLVFGDQEEMGLGVRVASPLRVNGGSGEIFTSSGKRNEKEAWGQPAKWCNYGGVAEGRRVGITLMSHPGNFRESWFHVRDYGLMVANPFGQNAFTRGEKSRVVVKPGEKLRLRFGVWIHSAKTANADDLENSYQAYLKAAGK